jgi:hypothetical protein
MDAKGFETALKMPFDLMSSSFAQIILIIESFILLPIKMFEEFFNSKTP